MRGSKAASVLIRSVLAVAVVVAGSFVSVRIWAEKPEEIPDTDALVYRETMTVAEFGQENSIPNPVLKEVLGLENRSELQNRVGDLGHTRDELLARVKKAAVVHAESESKNWNKILVKFVLWFVFLAAVLLLLRRGGVTRKVRIALYASAVVVFGVLLGSDPGPMGTVKDAIVLLGKENVVFPPRLIALAAFLLMVIVANKFICSWGCQVGTLQDFLFRMNRDSRDRPLIRQFRMPFRVTNTIRVLFFVLFTAAAFAWAVDIIDPIDPFKVFKPQKLGLVGGVFVGAVLLASIIVYRPWCHLFCPFGLVGWVLEHVSVFRITVDYDTCIACGACAKRCPSTVMDRILRRKGVIPDCFACGSCIEACPADAIRFCAGKRSRPPEGKFDKLE
jgi:NAD-dependent dihydropyrimidine dehydrogenase PreA subunit